MTILFEQMTSIFGTIQHAIIKKQIIQFPQIFRIYHSVGNHPRILELGLRELNALGQSGFEGATEVFEFLASLPTPAETVALRPSETLQARISALLEKNRTDGLTPDEEQEWEHYQYLEHLVRIAKARAHLKLKATS